MRGGTAGAVAGKTHVRSEVRRGLCPAVDSRKPSEPFILLGKRYVRRARPARFAFAGDHLTASFNAQSFGGRVEGGYRFMTVYGGLTPYAAVQAQNFRTPSYSETDLNGGGFALAYNARTATDTRSELGARFDRLLLADPTAVLILRARLAWAHDWVSDPTLAAVFQTLPGASFHVNGATAAKNSALGSAGAELRLANGVSLLGKFDGEFASHSSTYAGTGTVRYTW
jgi:outer membrane autotransporter protein